MVINELVLQKTNRLLLELRIGSNAEIGLLRLFDSAYNHREGNSMGGPHLLRVLQQMRLLINLETPEPNPSSQPSLHLCKALKL